jgi:hypothetical protein
MKNLKLLVQKYHSLSKRGKTITLLAIVILVILAIDCCW